MLVPKDSLGGKKQKKKKVAALALGTSVDIPGTWWNYDDMEEFEHDVATKVFAAKAALFGTEGQVSEAESAAGDRTSRLKFDQSRLIFDGAVQNAQIAANYGIKRAELAIEASRGAAQVWGQLAASVLSGVNLGASISYGESEQ